MNDYPNPLMKKDSTFSSYNFQKDFRIALFYGNNAIEETYKKVWREYKDNYKVITRLVYDLNSLCWAYYRSGDLASSKLFEDLFYRAEEMFYKKFETNESATDYYYRMLD